jgi:electron transport complex protein RnfB
MNSYERFREKIDTVFPFPAPASESKVEIELFTLLMTPEEAEMACALSPQPENAESIAARVGAGVETVRPLLEELVRKGMIFKIYTEDPLYCLAPMIPGIWEFQLGKFTPELVNLLQKYYAEGLGKAVMTLKPPALRIVPAQNSISSKWKILAYEEVESLIDKATSVALADCHCRTAKRMLGGGCEAPDDVCIVLDLWADYFEKNLNARKVTKDEARDALRRAADAGLVHSTTNSQEGSMFICNCCGCCCAGLRAITELKIPAAIAVAPSNFIAEIAGSDCTGCGGCVSRCHVGALTLDGDTVDLMKENCIGCGACISVCPTQAISMIRRDGQSTPVKTINELLLQIAEGRRGARS